MYNDRWIVIAGPQMVWPNGPGELSTQGTHLLAWRLTCELRKMEQSRM